MIGAVELKRGDTYHRVGLKEVEHDGEKYIVYDSGTYTEDEYRQINESIYTFYPDHALMTSDAWKRHTRQIDVDVTITVEKALSQDELQKPIADYILNTVFNGKVTV